LPQTARWRDTTDVADPRDQELRHAALVRVRELQRRYDDLIPLPALQQGFAFRGERVSFGSFFSGIFRPRQLTGPAALCLVTAPPKPGRAAPYDDEFDEKSDRFRYRFRSPRTSSASARLQAAADNRAWSPCMSLLCPSSTSAASRPASTRRSRRPSS